MRATADDTFYLSDLKLIINHVDIWFVDVFVLCKYALLWSYVY